MSAVTEVANTAIDAFITNDLESAYRVEPLEELIDNLCDEMKLHHIDRLQKGICTLNHGFVFNDLLTNLERISDHCSNIAVALIELESDSFDTHEYINSLIEVRSRTALMSIMRNTARNLLCDNMRKCLPCGEGIFS